MTSLPNYYPIPCPILKEIQETILPHLPPEFQEVNLFSPASPTLFEINAYLKYFVEKMKPWHEVLSVVIISAIPNSTMPIHIDSDLIPLVKEGKASRYALNIPLQNCENIPTIFYKPRPNANPITKNDGYVTTDNKLTIYSPDEVDQIDSFVLDAPCLFNTLVPHNVHNNSDKTRIILSLRFTTPFEDEAKYEV